MSQVPHILFGAAFTIAMCLAIGWMLVRRLRLDLQGGEEALFAFLSGAACLSSLMFVLAATHMVRRGVILCGGLAAIGWALGGIWRARRRAPSGSYRFRRKQTGLPRGWNLFYLVAFVAFFIVYFFNAMAPEVSPDGAGYHLGNVSLYWQRHGFAWDHHSIYAYLSQGMEMLFLVAFGFGQHSAAALVHMAFQTALPLLMVCYGRRFGLTNVATPAALAVYASPVAGITGISAYNDLAVATLLFAVFYLLQVWDENAGDRWLIICGLLAGFAIAVKYPAGIGLPFAAAFVWYRARRWKAVLRVIFPALLVSLPWALRNWFWLHNPAAPFLNRWFPNPFVQPGVERSYLEGLQHYPQVMHYWNIPWQLTVEGGLVPGILGPLFLLAPLALGAIGTRQGRRFLAAAAIFAIPAWFNTEPRFLIPALPFIALSIGLAVRRWPMVFPAMALVEAVLCFPPVLGAYAFPYSWHLRSIPVRAALRLGNPEQFLVERMPEYVLRLPIRHSVPEGEKIFSFAGRPSAYLEREVVVSYESALGNFAQDTLMAPIDRAPGTRLRFRFAPAAVRGIRVVQTGSAAAYWTVAELHFYSGGRELPRAPGWRTGARPNPWEAGLALDGNLATRWSTWDRMRPGDFLTIEFGRAETVDQVDLDFAAVPESHVTLEVLGDKGWSGLSVQPERLGLAPDPGLRRAATQALRAHDLYYLLINENDFVAADMRRSPEAWGIVELAEAVGVRLYRIE